MPILERSSREAYPLWLRSAQSAGAFLLLDKPRGWTSFEAVAFVRRQLRRRAGHAGTLDPLATGLLIVGIGTATKLLTDFQQLPKTYVTTLKLGAITETDDAEAPEQVLCPEVRVTEQELQQVLERFRGEISQTPPRYAAVKYRGKRLYELARAGVQFQPLPRRVTIFELELQGMELPYVQLRIVCSAGTYVRAIARDIGTALGCGAYVVELRRSAIGEYRVEEALTPEEFTQCTASYAPLHPVG
ncbi:tRNA pseudouridine synthase B [bacterium HR21]|nr:tRNA pseudouridine synthase B [bacterium HR21]